jgi:hypothetical protein
LAGLLVKPESEPWEKPSQTGPQFVLHSFLSILFHPCYKNGAILRNMFWC